MNKTKKECEECERLLIIINRLLKDRTNTFECQLLMKWGYKRNKEGKLWERKD